MIACEYKKQERQCPIRRANAYESPGEKVVAIGLTDSRHDVSAYDKENVHSESSSRIQVIDDKTRVEHYDSDGSIGTKGLNRQYSGTREGDPCRGLGEVSMRKLPGLRWGRQISGASIAESWSAVYSRPCAGQS